MSADRHRPAVHPAGTRALAILAAVAVTSLATGCADDVGIRSDVAYGAEPGQVLDIYLPDNERDDRAVVVLVHGGGWEQGGKADLARNARELAEEGIVAVSIDYRLPPPGERWPTELDDVRAAVRWVQEHADELDVDPARLGLYGSSAGGNLVMMVATTGGGGDLPPVRSVAAWSAPADLLSLTPPDGVPDPGAPPPGCGDETDLCIGVADPATLVDYLGCVPLECSDLYDEASPVTHVGPDTPQMFLAAAEHDFVPYAQVELMEAALTAEEIEVESTMVPGEGHAESLRGSLLARTIRWFERTL